MALAVDLVEEYDGDESFPQALEGLVARTDKPVAVAREPAVGRGPGGGCATAGARDPGAGGDGLGAPRAGSPAGCSAARARRRSPWTRSAARGGSSAGLGDWRALLADYGIGVAASTVVSARSEAVAAAEASGYPVVLKTAEEAIHHKTEADGVRLGLADGDAVGTAYDDLAERLGPRVLVQQQVSGVEVALGIVRDPLLGPLVVVAAGGVLVELVAERAVALPPVDRETRSGAGARAARRAAARRLPRGGSR